MALAGLVPPTDLQPRSYLVRHECNQITASDSTLIGCWCSAYLQLRNSLCEKGHKKDATLTPSHGGANLRLAFQSKLTLECVPVKTDFWYVPVKTLKGWRPAPVALHLHLQAATRTRGASWFWGWFYWGFCRNGGYDEKLAENGVHWVHWEASQRT